MTLNRRSLLADAEAKGYSVTTDPDGTTKILKQVGRWKKTEGLIIHPDGTAFDVSVELGIAKGIRSYAAMRRILGI